MQKGGFGSFGSFGFGYCQVSLNKGNGMDYIILYIDIRYLRERRFPMDRGIAVSKNPCRQNTRNTQNPSKREEVSLHARYSCGSCVTFPCAWWRD
jgi:hypothetical protein